MSTTVASLGISAMFVTKVADAEVVDPTDAV
jgi:hypothetical protein